MNGFVLAAVIIVVLFAVLLVLKIRASRKKSAEIAPVEQAETDTLHPPEPDAEAAPAPTADEPAIGTDGVDLDEAAVLAEQEEDLVPDEPEQPATLSGEDGGVIETDPVAVGAAEHVLFEPAARGVDEDVSPVEAAGEGESPPPEERELSAPIVAETDGPVDSGVAAELVEAEAGSQVVHLTREAYLARLNSLEEKQRAALARTSGQEDDKHRDRMQRELVIMNDKLALLDDSYSGEVACYQEVLQTLAQLDGTSFSGAEEAIAALQEGEPEKAEEFLTWLSEQEHPLAAQAGFHSGQLAECRVDLQTALDRYRRAVEQEPENALYLQAAGRTARSLYRYKEALPWFESFVRLCRGNTNAEPLTLALAQRELAYTYMLSGQYQKAGPLYKEAMSVMAKKLGQEHPEMATCWYQIGEFQETMGEYDKAVSLYRKALTILERTKGMAHPALAVLLDKLAALCMELEMEKEAVPLYERLVRIREEALRSTHPQLALSLNNLAESYRLQGQYLEAEDCYRKSLVINETLHGPEHPSVAAILQELAKLCTSQRKPDEARQYQERASAIFQKSVEASEKKSGQQALTLEL